MYHYLFSNIFDLLGGIGQVFDVIRCFYNLDFQISDICIFRIIYRKDEIAGCNFIVFTQSYFITDIDIIREEPERQRIGDMKGGDRDDLPGLRKLLYLYIDFHSGFLRSAIR